MTQFNPAFQVDTDSIGSVLAWIGFINTKGTGWDLTTGGTGGQTVSFISSDPTQEASATSDRAHGFFVGQDVEIRGLPDPYSVLNGIHRITAVGDTDVVGAYFNIQFPTNLGSVSVDALLPGLIGANGHWPWAQAQALSPPPSYVRYHPHDTLLDSITSLTTFSAEPWDYNTIRLVWGMDTALDARAARDVGYGLVPRIVITRSGFGCPSTPLDGQRILNTSYESAITSLDRPKTTEYFETQPASLHNDWNRPAIPGQGLYDRNLQPGKWLYYSLFFYLGEYDLLGVPVSYNPDTGMPTQFWVRANTSKSITPINSHHGERLYELIPEYFLMKDQEFLAGTGRKGVIERLLQSIGFEVDYTKTLADGVEHVYDIEHMNSDLMHSQGVSNFGVPVETGLGDIRYRSLLAMTSDLYEERGSVAGLQQMTTAATKYRCKVVEGINMMSLTDDAEFASEVGSWGNPLPKYGSFVHSHNWLGRDVVNFNAVKLSSVSLLTTPEGESEGSSLVLRRNAMLVGGAVSGGFDSSSIEFDDPSAFDGTAVAEVVSDIPFDDETGFDFPIDFDGSRSINNGVLVACGLGEGVQHGRRHESIPVNFYPRLHGIKCHPGTVYTFSGYSVLESNEPGPTGAAAVGIMWFNDDQNGYFNVDRDFISKAESAPSEEEALSVALGTPGPFKRYAVDALAPVSLRGQPFVFAVPYFIFADTFARYISACMFHAQLNSAESFAIPSVQYLRLGVPSEKLDSGYVLGEELR